MTALYLSIAADGNDQVICRPRPADAMGAALRGVFGDGATLPDDMLRLLRRLDRRCQGLS